MVYSVTCSRMLDEHSTHKAALCPPQLWPFSSVKKAGYNIDSIDKVLQTLTTKPNPPNYADNSGPCTYGACAATIGAQLTSIVRDVKDKVLGLCLPCTKVGTFEDLGLGITCEQHGTEA